MGIFDSLFGTSSSKSKVTQKENTLVINKNQLDLTNKTISESISNVMVKLAANCGAAVTQNQTIIFDNFNCIGCNFDKIKQGQYVTLDFNCEQVQRSKINVVKELDKQVATALKYSTDTDLLAIMEANAEAQITKGFASPGSGKSHSEIDSEINFTVTNEKYTNIETLLHNIFVNEITVDSLLDCGSKVVNSQFFGIYNSTWQDVYIGTIEQEQIVDLYTKCLQNQETMVDLTDSVAEGLKLTIDSSDNTKTVTEQTGSAFSETISRGVFESFGSALSSVIGGIFSGIGSLFNFGGLSGSSSSIILILLIISLVFAFLNRDKIMARFRGGFYDLSTPFHGAEIWL